MADYFRENDLSKVPGYSDFDFSCSENIENNKIKWITTLKTKIVEAIQKGDPFGTYALHFDAILEVANNSTQQVKNFLLKDIENFIQPFLTGKNDKSKIKAALDYLVGLGKTAE